MTGDPSRAIAEFYRPIRGDALGAGDPAAAYSAGDFPDTDRPDTDRPDTDRPDTDRPDTDPHGAGGRLRLGMAVSGGSDSLALLHLLHDRAGASLQAVTVDHGLRPEAAAEARMVARACERLGIAHATLTWKGAERRGNLQDAARRARYGLIGAWAAEHRLDAVALGHTLDDQAETVILRLARGAGVDGLSAMASRFRRDGMTWHRPLLSERRADLRAYLDARGVAWADDPSNDDPAFDRVRVRRAARVLETIGIGAEALSQVAGHMREARAALDHFAAMWARDHARVTAGDLVFDRAALLALPDETARRLLAAGLRWIASAEYPPRRGALAQAREAIGTQTNTVLNGCIVMVSAMTVRIGRELSAVAGAATLTDAAGGTTWDGRWRVRGPAAPGLTVGAVGADLAACPGWRATGMPRQTLLSSPAIRRGDTLVAAPVAGLSAGWTATAPDLDAFCAFLTAH